MENHHAQKRWPKGCLNGVKTPEHHPGPMITAFRRPSLLTLVVTSRKCLICGQQANSCRNSVKQGDRCLQPGWDRFDMTWWLQLNPDFNFSALFSLSTIGKFKFYICCSMRLFVASSPHKRIFRQTTHVFPFPTWGPPHRHPVWTLGSIGINNVVFCQKGRLILKLNICPPLDNILRSLI